MAVPKYSPEEKEKLKAGRHLLYKTPEELESKINEYFAEQEAKKEPLTMSGLAYFLGVDRDSLINYSHREAFFGTVKRARDRVIAETESRLLKAGTPTVGCIFWLKNNAGWVDKQEIETTSRVSLKVSDDIEDTAQGDE